MYIYLIHIIQLSIQIRNLSEQYQQSSDLENDYELKYFEPLIILTKNVIDLIDILQEEYN